MANINDVKQVFTDIANATRSKTGSSADLKPTQMASAISGIVSLKDLFNEYKRTHTTWDYTFSSQDGSLLNSIDLRNLDFSTTGSSAPYASPTKTRGMFQCFDFHLSNYTVPVFDTSRTTDAFLMFDNYLGGYPYLRIIPEFDFSNCTNLEGIFRNQSSLQEIHCYGMKVRFDISASTLFTESALVEILNNLATISTTQTLVMGTTNLNKLSADEQAIATNKGWTLA